MNRLVDLATVLRSKNAGPLYVTFDIMFDNEKVYKQVINSNVLTKQLIGEIYNLKQEQVEIINYDIVTSIKITIPREHISGSLLDMDIYGCQQQSQLSNIIIP